MRSRIQRWKPAGWSGPTPTYSSMWKTTVSAQGTPSVSWTRACTKASWELPVANMACAVPRAATAARSTAARLVGGGPGHGGHVGVHLHGGAVNGPGPGLHGVQHARRASARLEPVRDVELPGPGPSGGGVEGGAPLPRRDARGGRAPAGPSVSVKVETLQPTGSFKVRGGLAAVSATLEQDPGRAVVASSAGNHGLGLAFAASKLGATVTVVVPDRRLGGQGVGPPAVRRAPRAARRGLPRGRDPRPRAGGQRREPLRLALQRPRRHRGPGDAGPGAGRAGARPRHRGGALRWRWPAGRRHPRPRGDGRARRSGSSPRPRRP